MLAHTARRPLRPHNIHQLSQLAPAAFAVTLSTLAPHHSPPRAPSTTPRRPTTSANADKIPSQTATFRAAQLQSHFSSSSIPNSPRTQESPQSWPRLCPTPRASTPLARSALLTLSSTASTSRRMACPSRPSTTSRSTPTSSRPSSTWSSRSPAGPTPSRRYVLH